MHWLVESLSNSPLSLELITKYIFILPLAYSGGLTLVSKSQYIKHTSISLSLFYLLYALISLSYLLFVPFLSLIFHFPSSTSLCEPHRYLPFTTTFSPVHSIHPPNPLSFFAITPSSLPPLHPPPPRNSGWAGRALRREKQLPDLFCVVWLVIFISSHFLGPLHPFLLAPSLSVSFYFSFLTSFWYFSLVFGRGPGVLTVLYLLLTSCVR